MTIDITEFANVSISVSPTGIPTGNFGILGFLTNEEGVIPPSEGSRAYRGLAEVAGDWAADSEVYKAAIAYYAQTPLPTDFVVLMCYETQQAAQLVGGGTDTVEELKLIINGSFDIDIDGGTVNVTALDLSSVSLGEPDGSGAENGYDQVAALIQIPLETALAGTTCVHNGYSFIITSPTIGGGSTISFMTSTDDPDTAIALGLSQAQGKTSQGFSAETPIDALAKLDASGLDFTALVTHKKYRDDITGGVGSTTTELGDWCEAAKVIFMNTTNDLSTLSSSISTDVMSLLKAKTLRYSLTTFSRYISEYPSAAVFGRIASVNFENINSTITMNLKQLATVTAEDITPGEFQVLRNKYGSAVVQIGKTAQAYTDSRMASGSWLDTTHGLMWLENRIETDLFNMLYQSNTKIPYTQAGINTAVARVERGLEAAVKNGLCGPGYLPDGTYLPNGYQVLSVPLGDVPSGDKSNRIYRGISFKMIGAGALHQVFVTGEFAE